MTDTDPTAVDLIGFLDASPSPYHATREAARRLVGAGFTGVAPEATPPAGAGRFFTVEGGSLMAWVVPEGVGAAAPFRLVGAHTDSPTLRIKPRPDTGRVGVRQLGVEIYGGALLNSWLDRDLGLAGRVAVRTASGIEIRLLQVHRPILRVPQLAIHLDPDARSNRLVLDPQQHLAPMWSLGAVDDGGFARFLADELEVPPGEVLAHELVTYDLTGAALGGRDGEWISSGRLDNLVCSHAGLSAVIAAATEAPAPHVAAVVLFDHEEIGSRSATGAGGAWLGRQLERAVIGRGGDRDDFLRALAASVHLSADMTHATHPNYPERHEPAHPIALNGGPVVKVSANMLYGTDAPTHAVFLLAAEQAGVPVQYFVNRNEARSGSTIGPIVAAGLAVPTVDVGNPCLAMHSSRELCGSKDPAMLVGALTSFLAPA